MNIKIYQLNIQHFTFNVSAIIILIVRTWHIISNKNAMVIFIIVEHSMLYSIGTNNQSNTNYSEDQLPRDVKNDCQTQTIITTTIISIYNSNRSDTDHDTNNRNKPKVNDMKDEKIRKGMRSHKCQFLCFVCFAVVYVCQYTC